MLTYCDVAHFTHCEGAHSTHTHIHTYAHTHAHTHTHTHTRTHTHTQDEGGLRWRPQQGSARRQADGICSFPAPARLPSPPVCHPCFSGSLSPCLSGALAFRYCIFYFIFIFHFCQGSMSFLSRLYVIFVNALYLSFLSRFSICHFCHCSISFMLVDALCAPPALHLLTP